ncbi:LPS-assembly protein LptD [Halomonas sp. MCCC 1A11057]|jgi:LPS-assembly protein|uniref:LPS-assembly protein LptD n=1 Tax=Halomonas sp. MCCC 1A11057 TaxID=2733482 RepID=UPI001F32C94E|nr:LPS-assembly protein LptD [Halomonas sp. MCCC 1A11057]MCE8033507.1 LPS-assembly protein LptD [Halomonas sp. MCCC 1A11057]
MGKRHAGTALAGLITSGLALGTPQAMALDPLPAWQLDWHPWSDDRPAEALCRGTYIMPAYRLPATDEPGQVRSESDSAYYGDEGETILGGEVILRRGDTQLESPRVNVPAARDRAHAEGPLALRDLNLLVRGEAGEVSLNSDAASIDSAHFVVHDQHLRGDAMQLERLEDGRFRLTSASFTTCDPGSNLWQLVTGDLVLDRESGFGTARHARLEMGNVPVFYWPWVRFPIDDRRHTGFLWPELGFSGGALDYAQPFYWNIAPNHDATIVPRWIQDRGLLLGGEYRYLYPSDAGQIEGAYISSDGGGSNENPNDPSRRYEGEDRWYVDYRHTGRFDTRTSYNLRYGAASDGRYFDDFGSPFGDDPNNMQRLARINYRGDLWNLDARAQGFQRLDDPLQDRKKPFYRLPSLTATARWSQPGGWYQQWRSNATYFWRDVDRNRVPLREAAVGTRLHLSPATGWRFDETWGHLEPRVEWLYTAYDLDYGERVTERDTSLQRAVPVSSIDGGLVFERELELGGREYRQTLEPRFNYAYVPTRDQSEFPDFDSDERAFSWNQLWSPYRFSGSDRIGDLNRLSLGVSSRFLEDASGRERFTLGVGQALYFDDRNIDMAGDPDTLPPPRADGGERLYQATRDRSPLVTRLDWHIDERWSTRYEWLYDDHRSRTERSSVGVAYRDPRGHVLNLAYRWQLEGFDPSGEDEDRLGYDREEYELSFAYKMNPRIDLIGRFLYDHTNRRSLEQLAGVQWNDCCYGLQVVWREWVNDNDTANTIADDFNERGLFLRFVFKGLGGVGGDAGDYFERAIPGYRATAF